MANYFTDNNSGEKMCFTTSDEKEKSSKNF